jgi:hypothetical protein
VAVRNGSQRSRRGVLTREMKGKEMNVDGGFADLVLWDMLALGDDNAGAVWFTGTRELRRLEEKGKGSGGRGKRYQRQKLAPRRRRIYFASHLLKAAFDELPSWFLLVVCQGNKPEKQKRVANGMIDWRLPIKHLWTNMFLQGDLKQDLSHDPPCHPRAVC